MTKDVRAKVPTEDYEQIKLATWLTKNNILFYAIPNGGHRHMLEAMKFKRMGVQSGVPDLCIPIPSTTLAGGVNKSFHALYIELKRVSGGTISDNQLYWKEMLSKYGYLSVICKGADAAIQVVKDYLGLAPILGDAA